MSWNFLCADMFPCGDSKTLSVCPYPEKRNHHPGSVNISPTLVIDTSMERSSRVLQHLSMKIWFKKKNPKSNFNLQVFWLLFSPIFVDNQGRCWKGFIYFYGLLKGCAASACDRGPESDEEGHWGAGHWQERSLLHPAAGGAEVPDKDH